MDNFISKQCKINKTNVSGEVSVVNVGSMSLHHESLKTI